MATIGGDEGSFIAGVSGATGIDPRVLYAQIQSEGHPGDEAGYFNWLNIPTSTASYNVSKYGAPGATSTGPGGTAAFGSLAAGVKATVTEEYAIGLGQERGKSVQQQIRDIQGSGWASSGYPNLPSVFIDDFGQAAYGSQSSAQPANPNSIGSANILGVGASYGQLANKLTPNLGFLTGWVSEIWQLVKIYSLRVLEVIAGGLLVIVSLFMLARGGVPSPV